MLTSRKDVFHKVKPAEREKISFGGLLFQLDRSEFVYTHNEHRILPYKIYISKK